MALIDLINLKYTGADPESGKRGGHLAEKKLKSKKKKKRSQQ